MRCVEHLCYLPKTNYGHEAARTCPTASAAADPPDDPPTVFVVSQGLSVVPYSWLYV